MDFSLSLTYNFLFIYLVFFFLLLFLFSWQYISALLMMSSCIFFLYLGLVLLFHCLNAQKIHLSNNLPWLLTLGLVWHPMAYFDTVGLA